MPGTVLEYKDKTVNRQKFLSSFSFFKFKIENLFKKSKHAQRPMVISAKGKNKVGREDGGEI